MYYAMLEKILVVDGNILIKSVGMFDFGRLHKIFSRRIEFVDSIKKLKEIEFIASDNVADTIPDELIKVRSGVKKSVSDEIGMNEEIKGSKSAENPVKRDFLTV